MTAAIHAHLADKKLILGICNGSKPLLSQVSGHMGKIKDLAPSDLTLYRNDLYRHISNPLP